MKTRKLPSGKFTESLDEYIEEWSRIRLILEDKLDLVTIGYDPGFFMKSKDGTGNPVEIPTWLAIRIIDSIQK